MIATSRPVRSLALRTDLMFVSWGGVVTEEGDAVVARTPASPDYYFGNFLLYPDAPRAGEAAAWMARFGEVFGDDPRIEHVCLRWDRPDGAEGELSQFVAAAFTIDHNIALTTPAVRPPPRPNRDVTLRPIASDADWAAVERLQVATAITSFGPLSDAWARDMVATYRALVAAKRGLWFGAFDATGALAADMGIFVEDGVARFRAVETDPAFRRRGICGTLVHHVASVALADLGAEQLVMVADPEYHAAQVYESVGFVPAERLVAVYRKPARMR